MFSSVLEAETVIAAVLVFQGAVFDSRRWNYSSHCIFCGLKLVAKQFTVIIKSYDCEMFARMVC